MILRKEYLNKLWKLKDLEIIKVITGIRRCGKSTLLKQFETQLLLDGVDKDQIVSINFEELENEKFLDYNVLYDHLKSKIIKNKTTYFFLDEIQMVNSFEKVINSLFVKENTDIYITGSNAYLLSSELATLLSGRYIEINLLPFSFKEYIELMTAPDNDKLFSDYLINGGLPYASLIRKNNIGSDLGYIEGIYNTVFIKDIQEREKRREINPLERKITDIQLLKDISKYLSSVIGNPVSMNSIANYLTSSGRKTSHVTVGQYVQALEESYLFYKCERMDVKGKKLLKLNYKYYMVDLGFRRHILAQQKYDIGFSLENIVYFELLRRGYQVNIGKVDNQEVDFVAFKDGVYEYIQVSATVLDETTFNREITPLQNINDNYPKFILTSDKLGLGNYDGIEVVNIIDWLLFN
ncbi:MAG: ATP-binding protein [Acholeplasmataceae bacterium]|jgi:predicted AAA+ superfamily ATPase